jgi:formylglycine-generating enzyme required for sulfatase activity
MDEHTTPPNLPNAPATAAPSTQAESPLPSIGEGGRELGPSPAPDGAESVPHLTPTSLSALGFRGYVIDEVGCVLPPLCPVPAGTFPMGSDKTRDKYARHNEMPQYPVLVGDFAIGQHPVTVAEYACAVRAGSVREPPRVHAGVDWPWSQQLQHLDHPVVCVDWEDALAYVRWLAEVTGQPWRLPTEAEWEMAAHGPDGRIYPWGDAVGTTRCNTNASGLGTTSPVGAHPSGASPCGVQDMAGNVWEWTCSHYKPYAYDQQYGTEDLDTPGNRVLRGGSWGDEPIFARVACRSYVIPGIIRHTYGFRVALSAVASS